VAVVAAVRLSGRQKGTMVMVASRLKSDSDESVDSCRIRFWGRCIGRVCAAFLLESGAILDNAAGAAVCSRLSRRSTLVGRLWDS